MSVFSTAKDGMIDECDDFGVTVEGPADSDQAWLQAKGGPFEGLASEIRKGKVTEVKKRCAEQFSDRTALATCTVTGSKSPDGGTPVETTLLGAYYNYGILSASDAYMQQCLKMKGDWKAVSRDSVEWQSAKVEHHQRALKKMMNE